MRSVGVWSAPKTPGPELWRFHFGVISRRQYFVKIPLVFRTAVQLRSLLTPDSSLMHREAFRGSRSCVTERAYSRVGKAARALRKFPLSPHLAHHAWCAPAAVLRSCFLVKPRSQLQEGR